MKYTKEPGMISFAGGNPDPEIFPVAEFGQASQILTERGKEALQYGATDGFAPLKDFIAQWMAPRMGRVTATEEMVVTTGSQQMMDLLCTALIDPGDCAIVEEPTYPGSIHTMRNHHVTFLTCPCDEDGMVVDALPEIIEKARKAGQKVKFIYTIVNFHNPAGVTLSLERRRKLLDIASRYGILIFEDDPYGHLRYDGDHLPTIFSMDNEGIVLFACSFSKILAPGTRVAWAVGDKDLIRSLVMVKQGVDLCTSVVAQALVYEYCRQGNMESFLPKIVAHYGKKRDAMAQAFEKHLPADVRFVKPAGGFFFWLNLPGVDTKELFFKAVERKVAFVTGPAFYPSGSGGENNLRSCFTFASTEQIDEGARRLAQAIADLKG
ncbi:MAG: PLP-dependent aminotransferase family protein [Synergistaceae bacterium]|nr:PLP-dependent aminotransferase family protein [Synergistaceae bacterium]